MKRIANHIAVCHVFAYNHTYYGRAACGLAGLGGARFDLVGRGLAWRGSVRHGKARRGRIERCGPYLLGAL